MDKKYIIIISILIIVIGAFASLMIYEKLTGVNRIEPMDSARQELKDSLKLEVKIAKTNYETGEIINNGYLDGQYFVEYDGTPFEAIILYVRSRDGFDQYYDAIEKRLIENMNGSLGHPMDVFRIDENSSASNQKYFHDADTYTYGFIIYDCQIIEEKLNKLCESINLDDIDDINKIEPLGIASKDIIVTGEKIDVGCKKNDDCIKICDFCKRGKQTCEMGQGVCIDCLFDSACKDGYECKEYKCIGKGTVQAPSAPTPINQETQLAANCDAFPDMLSSCTRYKCEFIHPFTGEAMGREVLGIIDGKCNYIEQMPNGGQMECKYTESFRKVIAQYYKDNLNAESSEFEIDIDLGSDDIVTKYTIDGKEVENPLQEATDNGFCTFSGY